MNKTKGGTMADTLFEIPEQDIDNKGTIFNETDNFDMILQNRDRIDHCECYRNDTPGSEYYKIIVNRVDSDKIIAIFNNSTRYETAITRLKG